VVAWLGADSVQRSLLSATRADELALANERILTQAQLLEGHQRQLHDRIGHLQTVLTTFARGNFEVRVQFADNVLHPLAMALNMFLTQMQRLLREQEQRVRIEYAARELATALRRARAGYGYAPPQYTGTAFDEVLLAIVSWLQRRQESPSPSAVGPVGPTTAFPEPPSLSLSSLSSLSASHSAVPPASLPGHVHSPPGEAHAPRTWPEAAEPQQPA